MPFGDPSSERRPLVALYCLAAVVRLTVLGITIVGPRGTAAWHEPDSELYLELGRRLATEHRFDSDLPRPGAPELVRTPGYPAFLAACDWLGPLEPVAMALQVCLSLATVVLVAGCARELGAPPRAVHGAAFLAAVEPLGWISAAKLLSETLTTFLLMLSLWAGLRAARAATLRAATARGGLAGGALALAALVRPACYPLALATAVGLAVAVGFNSLARGPKWTSAGGRRLAAAATALLVLGTGMASWHARNWARARYPTFAGIGAVNLFFYQAAAVEARATGQAFLDVRRRWGYDAGEHAWIERYGPSETSLAPALIELGRRGRETCQAHPVTALRVHLAGCARMLLDPGGTDLVRLWRADTPRPSRTAQAVDEGLAAAVAGLVRDDPAVAAVQLLLATLLAATYALALGNLARLLRVRPGLALLVGGIVAALVLVGGGPAATARFRQPVMPLVCLLAGLGTDHRRISEGSRSPWASTEASTAGGTPG